MKIDFYGEEFEGNTAEEVVENMRGSTWYPGKNLDEYMQMVAERVWKFGGKSLIIQGDTQEERCRDFINGLERLDLVRIEGGIQ